MVSVKIANYADQVATDLSEKFDGLYPRWTTVVATLLALLVLMLIMTKLLYKPVKKMVAERKKFIQSNIDESIKQSNLASQDRQEANQTIIEARETAAKIVSEAKFKAERVRESSISRAKDDAHQIVISAQSDMEREKEIFEIQAKKEMVEVALQAAKKIIEKEVDQKTNRKIISDFIEESFEKHE